MEGKIMLRLGVFAPALLAGCITVQLPEPISIPQSSAPASESPPADVEARAPAEQATPAPPPIAAPAQPPATDVIVEPEHDYRAQAAAIAVSMLGRPYWRGGNTPRGFDCSGLVHFSYAKLGVSVPRDTRGLLNGSYTIDTSVLRMGDLVFFHVEGKRYSHVGIYLDDGRFVHAPASGGAVRIESLTFPYWAKHFASARRLATTP